MPRNVTGGSGHRAQRNSESSKEKQNRGLVESMIEDFANGETPTGVFIGRVLKRMGNGRMDVMYLDDNSTLRQRIIPLRGGLTGRGKKDVWVDVDSVVMIHETGLANATHEIVAVFSDAQIHNVKRVRPELERSKLFAKNETSAQDDGFEFDHGDGQPTDPPNKPKSEKDPEVDIDTI